MNMVTINGVRYRIEDARRLGLLPAPVEVAVVPEPTLKPPAPAKARTPKNKARTPENKEA